MSCEAVEAPCADDGSCRGMNIGAPERAKAVRDFSEDDAGSERTLSAVVGGRHVAIGHEGEELAAPSFGLAEEFGARLGDHRHGQQTIEPAIGGGRIWCECRIFQCLSPSSDGDRPAQRAAARWCELRLAGVDGVLDVAQDIGEADLGALRGSAGPASGRIPSSAIDVHPAPRRPRRVRARCQCDAGRRSG